MADLVYSTEAMRSSAKRYQSAAQNMKDIKKDLKKEVDNLSSVYWQSDAGKAFMEVYNEDWADSVDKYVAVLEKMAELLNCAAEDYASIDAELRKIPGITL